MCVISCLTYYSLCRVINAHSQKKQARQKKKKKKKKTILCVGWNQIVQMQHLKNPNQGLFTEQSQKRVGALWEICSSEG